MPIDRDLLLEQLRLWFPPETQITDEQILVIAELIIAMVGDDEEKHGEVFCKTLEAIAKRMMIFISASTTSGAKRREETDEVVVEWHNTSTTPIEGWQQVINSLPSICPLYGYTPKNKITGGLKLFSNSPYNPCGCPPKKC